MNIGFGWKGLPGTYTNIRKVLKGLPGKNALAYIEKS
jgi:hypothetical protein